MNKLEKRYIDGFGGQPTKCKYGYIDELCLCPQEKQLDTLVGEEILDGIIDIKAGRGEKKNLDQKLRIDLVHPIMIQALAEGLQAGIKKGYQPWNWLQGLPLDSVSVAAATRHLLKWRNGVDIDEETQVHHLILAMLNLGMAVTQIKLGRKDLDDRPCVELTDVTG